MAEKNYYDVIVIGAGIEGSSVAYNLVKQNKSVLLLEQFALPHTRGSSHGQSRIIRKAYTQQCYAEMMNEAYDMWHTLETETNTSLYKKTGLLVVSQPPSQAVNNTAKALQSQGAQFRRLTGAELKREFKQFNFDAECEAIYENDGGILRADRCLSSLQKMFVSLGGVLGDAEPVVKVTPITAARVIVTSQRRTYDAGSVVITAGAWTQRLLKPLGLNLPLKPLGINVCYWRHRMPGYHADQGFPDFIVALSAHDVYGLPSFEYPDHTKVCVHYGDEVDPDKRDLVSSTRDLQELRSFVSEHLPGLESKPSIIEKCMYTTTPDSDFILDRHPLYGNVVIGAGFSGHGFKMAPVIGKILGELATGQKPSYNLEPFRVNRFGTRPLPANL